jgi:hypothetical protein
MKKILLQKILELEKQKKPIEDKMKSIEDEIKKLRPQLDKIYEDEKIEKYIKEQRKNVFEKFEVKTIDDICKSKEIYSILRNIIEKHDIKTYERILMYFESNGTTSRFIKLLPNLLGLMLKYDWVDMIAMTNLFIRDNNIMIQQEYGYVNELLYFLRPRVVQCECDCGTFSGREEYKPKRIFTSLRTLIGEDNMISLLHDKI